MAVAGIHLEAVANRVWGWKFRGTAPVGDLGDEVPQKPKQFADIIYRFWLQKRSKFFVYEINWHPDSWLVCFMVGLSSILAGRG